MATKKGKGAAKDDDTFFEDGDDALIINMEEVEGQSFEAIPKGTYDGVIEELEFKMSNSSGKPMWSVAIVITDGEYRGRKLFTNLSFSEGALPGTKTNIQRFAPDILTRAFDPRKIAAEGKLVGKAVRVKTKLETYEGEERTKIAAFVPAKKSDGFEV